MKLTPLHLRRQQSNRAMRGYHPVEIDPFMEMTATEFEELLKSQKDMRDRVIELEVQLKDYRQIEKTLQQTLLQAQETTGKTYETARKEAELITRDAEQKAAGIIAQAHLDLSQLKRELQELATRKEALVHQLRVILHAELDLLKTLEHGAAEGLRESSPAGTGKAAIDLERVARTLDHD